MKEDEDSSLRLARLSRKHARVAQVIRRVSEENLTYLDLDALCDLAEVALQSEDKQLEGMIVEAGCALGGSALVLASAKSRERQFRIYDVFGMIPAPSQRDGADVHERYRAIAGGRSAGIGEDPYYGYQENLYQKVRGTFSRYELEIGRNNIHLVEGFYQDTLYIRSAVALAHLDCDWHDSVALSLERIEPHLVPGGTLIVDDYDCWSGCRRAVDDYFASSSQGNYKFVKESRLHITKER